MEERVPSAECSTEYFAPPPHSPPHSPPSSPPSHHNSIIQPLPIPPGLKTFVIRTPRDQVYRVPPPENSKIVESYIKKNQEKKGPGNCIWILLGLVILGVSLGLFFGVVAALYKPEIPEFEITDFKVTQKHPKQEYEITLNVKNPNARMEVSYGGDRYGLLSFDQKKVADGKFEPFSQEAEKSSNLTINLKERAQGQLPSEMESSMNSNKTKKAESLGFKMFVTATISSWAKTSHREITVPCTFKVNTLAKDTRIIYQDCSTEVQ
ncbi:hypothetical protein DCAR_0313014 [Daucus carota subsp. sativus]|uniref:Late embryogenesis abundant protein LEA-2 subgroup domain-containing protein n=1 Tax=Daucus carota subsp. sativus TaxID=79200 RepID=A0AAF0WPG6_DAUCS|nr:PREDICTED: uncharacterized protein LOC108210945 [Daucus carota subsp. sativus]WOG93727.1 hypothetical protein DCAR_0313014 [Daucus carota subsp. sativus]